VEPEELAAGTEAVVFQVLPVSTHKYILIFNYSRTS